MPRTMGGNDATAGSSRSKRSQQFETVEERGYELLTSKNQFMRSFATSFIQLMNLMKFMLTMNCKAKKIIKFRLGGRAHNLTLLEFACRLGLYYADELEEDGFDVYFQGGLHSDDNFNAQEYWLIISKEESLGLSRSHASSIRIPILRVVHKMITYGLCQRTMGESQIYYGQFIAKIARKSRVLTDAVLRSLSAPIYCRDLDTTTLRELIDFEGRLIPEDPQPGVPRVENGKSDRECFRCGDPNHLIGECPKPPKDKNERVRGSWSDSGDEDNEKVNNETCLVAQASSELNEEALKLTKFEKSTHCLNEMLNNQIPFGEKLGLGFNSFEASSSGTKKIKFVKAQKKASSDGGPITMSGPLNVQAAPKANMGPPLGTTPGSEKSVSFQKSILGPRPKHMIVNNVRVPVASDNEVKQFYNPLLKPRICLRVDLEPDEWIKDSGCSKHMTGNRKFFSSYKAYNGGQICDNKCRVTFSKHDSEITKDGKVIGRGIRKKGLYVMKLGNKPKDKIYLATIDENSTLWYRRLGHANMCLIQSLSSKELVRNLPKLKFDQHFYDACKIRKQSHASHKAKNIVSTTRCLELLHMDLFGPSAVRRYGGSRYTLVIVDDYSRYTWTRFLKNKTKAFDQFEILKPKNVNEALGDESWIVAMQEELNQFIANDI
ncbi:retrovirus-related pol polyprotein from transposon TNT 1-94 [Tanacetum coccineum]